MKGRKHLKISRSKLSDEELMALFIHHEDHTAFSELYKRYGQRLLGFFIKMFKGNVPKSQDFLQELFVRIAERKKQFDPNNLHI